MWQENNAKIVENIVLKNHGIARKLGVKNFLLLLVIELKKITQLFQIKSRYIFKA